MMNFLLFVRRASCLIQHKGLHTTSPCIWRAVMFNDRYSRRVTNKNLFRLYRTRTLRNSFSQTFLSFPVSKGLYKLMLQIHVPRRIMYFGQARYSSQETVRKVNERHKNTFYDILEVHPSATQSEIKSAYYELSMKFHPDVNSTAGTREGFTDITKAYSILSKLESRREYDKEIGTYYMMRSYQKSKSGEKVLRLMDDVLEIDMKNIKQSTTFMCNLVSLSLILGTPVRLSNIANTKKPYGIQSRDFRMLQLLRKICNGTLVAHKGSTTVTFIPSDLQSGMFSSEAGRFGSISLLLESALPCLAFGPNPEYSKTNILSIKGTTHCNYGLHIDYMDKVYRPLIKKFGCDLSVEIRKKSYLPHWDGKVVFRCLPSPQLGSVSLTNCGAVNKISGWCFVAGSKPIRVAQIMAKNVLSKLKKRFPFTSICVDSTRDRDSRSEGNGQGVMILGETSTGLILSGTALWQKGMGSEEVVDKALNMFVSNTESGTCVDDQLQDKVILLMAIASGRSVIRCGPPTERTKSAIVAIETLTKVRFTITKDSHGRTSLISCGGLGLVNKYVNDFNEF